MHPLFIGFYAPVIFLGFRTLISLGLRTRFISLGLRTLFLWVYAPVYFLGFMHPLFIGFYAPVIFLGFTHPLFIGFYAPAIFLGFTHPYSLGLCTRYSLGLRTRLFLGTMHPFISLGLRTHYFFVFYISITFLLDFYTPTDLFKIMHQHFFAWSTLSPHPLGFDMVYMLTILRLVFEPTIFVGCLCILVGCNIYLQSST
jgi:hypothetical protein